MPHVYSINLSVTHVYSITLPLQHLSPTIICFVYKPVTHFSPHCKQLTKALEPKRPATLLSSSCSIAHLIICYNCIQSRLDIYCSFRPSTPFRCVRWTLGWSNQSDCPFPRHLAIRRHVFFSGGNRVNLSKHSEDSV